MIGSIAWPSVRTLAIAGVAVVVVLLIALGGWLWYDAQQRRVQAAYAEVTARVQAALGAEAPAESKVTAARDLEAWLGRYPSARPVPEAAYELGNVRFGLGQFASARTAYELALQRGASGTLRGLVRVALARTWEAERDFGRAADAYGALVKDLDARNFLYEDALLDQARTQELAGRKAEAVATYQKLLKDVPTARRAEDVRIRLAALGTASR